MLLFMEITEIIKTVQMKKAIVFGASGFIGSYLVEALLNNDQYDKVTIVVRKNSIIHHPKLTILTGDINTLTSLKDQIKAEEVFIALGTTKKKTPDQKEYYRIDHDYPVLAAKIAKDNGAKSVFLVSSIGANAASGVFYTRTKGKTEQDIIALNFDHTHIFRPSLLLGNRKENRPLEKFFLKIWPIISLIFRGTLSRYRGIEGKEVAQAMQHAALHQTEKVKIYYWKEMNHLCKY